MARASQIFKILSKEYPKARIALKYGEPFQLLVATILSAQCTDKRVNLVTKDLFKKYTSIKDYADADLSELQKNIRSTGFFRQKAKSIKGSAQIVLKEFGGKLPKSMAELTTLPGVARKTANIVLSNSYGIVQGVAVDTHNKRLSYRLGLSSNSNPDKIEQDLMKQFPKKDWNKITYLLIEHGRAVCKAPVPICSHCVLNKICPRKGVIKSK